MRLLKIGVVIMTACTVLLVYIYGSSNSHSWSGLHTTFISDQSLDTVADSDKQGIRHGLLLQYVCDPILVQELLLQLYFCSI